MSDLAESRPVVEARAAIAMAAGSDLEVEGAVDPKHALATSPGESRRIKRC